MNPILRLHVQLLLAQYGREQVQEALNESEDVDLPAVQEGVKLLSAPTSGNAKPKRRRRRKSPRELVQTMDLTPEIKPLVERVAAGYDGKEFLPELWRVRKFLESEGMDASRLRSRADALPKVLAVLANRPEDSLRKLISEWERGSGGSDLAVLADAIMRPVRRAASGDGGQ